MDHKRETCVFVRARVCACVCVDVTWRAPVASSISTAAAGPRRAVVMATSWPGHVHSVAHPDWWCKYDVRCQRLTNSITALHVISTQTSVTHKKILFPPVRKTCVTKIFIGPSKIFLQFSVCIRVSPTKTVCIWSVVLRYLYFSLF